MQDRSGPKKPPEPRKPHFDTTGVDTSLPGVSATDKRIGTTSTANRNYAEHAKKTSSVALEDSASGKPSRKSTRDSANRTKTDSNLKQRQTRAVRSPAARAAKADAQSK